MYVRPVIRYLTVILIDLPAICQIETVDLIIVQYKK